jgi:hypothetical protein
MPTPSKMVFRRARFLPDKFLSRHVVPEKSVAGDAAGSHSLWIRYLEACFRLVVAGLGEAGSGSATPAAEWGSLPGFWVCPEGLAYRRWEDRGGWGRSDRGWGRAERRDGGGKRGSASLRRDGWPRGSVGCMRKFSLANYDRFRPNPADF